MAEQKQYVVLEEVKGGCGECDVNDDGGCQCVLHDCCTSDTCLKRVKDVVVVPQTKWAYIQRQLELLSCLEAMGVDNWSGYEEAWAMMTDEEDDD